MSILKVVEQKSVNSKSSNAEKCPFQNMGGKLYLKIEINKKLKLEKRDAKLKIFCGAHHSQEEL